MIDRQLAHYPHQFRKKKIPKSVLDEAKKRVLDTLACYYGAYNGKPSRAMRSAFLIHEKGSSTVWGTRQTVGPELAAWMNGTGVRTLDFNDTYLSKEPCHPSDLLASFWACTELTQPKTQGKELLHALVLGYEVLCRLCDAKSIRLLGWDHVTYLPIASAVGCAYLLKLNPVQTRHAVALSINGNNALRQTRVGTISDWKASCAAYAARSGLWAARLAKEGFTGPSDVFSGKNGFFKQVSGRFSISSKLGSTWKIMQTHTKYFPAEHHSQSAIEAALVLRKEINVSQIKKITVETFDVAVQIIGSEAEKWAPTTRETADHSMPYLVAAALLDGDINLRQYEKKRYQDSDIKRLLKKTRVIHDPKLSKYYPKRLPVRLRVQLNNGTSVSAYSQQPRGYAGNPMTLAEVSHKFHLLAGPKLSLQKRKALFEKVKNLNSVANLKSLSRSLR